MNGECCLCPICDEHNFRKLMFFSQPDQIVLVPDQTKIDNVNHVKMEILYARRWSSPTVIFVVLGVIGK